MEDTVVTISTKEVVTPSFTLTTATQQTFETRTVLLCTGNPNKQSNARTTRLSQQLNLAHQQRLLVINEKFLTSCPGIFAAGDVTDTPFKQIIIAAGEGAKAGDKVTVNYVGTLENGTKFDSSIDRGTPFVFTLGQNSVIQGWELGVLGMKVGEKRKLTIPPELAYGSQGAGGVIPPNATLNFEIDMLGINQ